MVDVTLKNNISGETKELTGPVALLVVRQSNGDVVFLMQGSEDTDLVVALLDIMRRKLNKPNTELN